MRFHFLCLAGLVCPLSALASPLDRSLVPANSAVTAHFDVETFAASQVGKAIISHRDQFKLGGLDGLKAFGIEPFRDFLGVTLFMPGVDSETPVVIVRATEAIDALWKHLQTEPQAKSMNSGGYDILSWDDKGERKYGVVRNSGNARLAFICDNWEPLVDALKTADGKSPAQKEGPMPAAGSFVFVDVRGLPQSMLDDDDGPMAVLREVRSAVIDGGESGEDLFASANIEMSSAQTVTEVQQMVQGMAAFGRMALKDHKNLTGVRGGLDGFVAKADGKHLVLSTKWKAAEAAAAAGDVAKEMSDADDEDDDDAKPAKKPGKKGS